MQRIDGILKPPVSVPSRTKCLRQDVARLVLGELEDESKHGRLILMLGDLCCPSNS